MDREAFEHLVSDWLDDPQRGNVRTQLDAAIARDAGLAQLRDQYVRLNAVIRAARAAAPPVAWAQLKGRIAAEIDRLAPGQRAGDQLDEQLHLLPEVAARVDWQAFYRRVTRAIDAAAARPRVLLLPNWRTLVAAGSLAAAAAIVLLFSYFPLGRPSHEWISVPGGYVSVAVLPATGAGTPTAAGRGTVHVSVLVEPGATAGRRGDVPPADASDDSGPDIYYLEPPDPVLAMALPGGLALR